MEGFDAYANYLLISVKFDKFGLDFLPEFEFLYVILIFLKQKRFTSIPSVFPKLLSAKSKHKELLYISRG